MRPAVLVPPSLQTGVRTHLPTTSIWCARMPRPPPTPHCVRVHTDALPLCCTGPSPGARRSSRACRLEVQEVLRCERRALAQPIARPHCTAPHCSTSPTTSPACRASRTAARPCPASPCARLCCGIPSHVPCTRRGNQPLRHLPSSQRTTAIAALHHTALPSCTLLRAHPRRARLLPLLARVHVRTVCVRPVPACYPSAPTSIPSPCAQASECQGMPRPTSSCPWSRQCPRCMPMPRAAHAPHTAITPARSHVTPRA